RQAVAEDHDPVERFGEPVRYGCEEHDTKRDREDDGRTATCQLDSHGALLLGPTAWRTLRLHAVVIHGRASRARHRAVTVANGRRRALNNGSVRGRGEDVRTRRSGRYRSDALDTSRGATSGGACIPIVWQISSAVA